VKNSSENAIDSKAHPLKSERAGIGEVVVARLQVTSKKLLPETTLDQAHFRDKKLFRISTSGGGTRSATFALGIVVPTGRLYFHGVQGRLGHTRFSGLGTGFRPAGASSCVV